MQESMNKYFKVGIIQGMLYPTPDFRVEDTLRGLLMDEFWDAVELPPMGDAMTRKRIRRMLDISSVTSSYVGPPRLFGAGLNLNSLDKDERAKAVATLKTGIDEAYDYGCIDMSIVSGKFEKDKKDDYLKALEDSVSELCQYAKDNGSLKIALEIFDYDVDKCVIIGPAPDAASFAAKIRGSYDNFGLLLDHCHLPLTHETPEFAINAVKDHLIHAHIGNNVKAEAPKDSASYGDQHPRFGFPNGANTETELADFLRNLLKVGFLNAENPPIVSFEVKPQGAGTMAGYEDPELVSANVKRVLKRAWALV